MAATSTDSASAPEWRQMDESVTCEDLVHRLYEHFNARRLDAAAALFHDDAVLEHARTGKQQRGGAGYLEFVQMWLGAFPDAVVAVERVTSRTPASCEVDLLASGTHLGPLDLGGYGLFKPTGAVGKLRLRQMLEVKCGKFAFSSLSFAVQDIVQQLVTIDVPALLRQLEKVNELRQRLAATRSDNVTDRRSVLDRLGVELDAARRLVRPYFDR